MDIQNKLDEGAEDIEKALDLLDHGGVNDTPHRHSATDAIAKHFSDLEPPLDVHVNFLQNLSRRPEPIIPIFTLNYDPLLERAAEISKTRLIDGFLGIEQAFFEPSVFQERSGTLQRRIKGPTMRFKDGTIHLLKLHGSLGWYECSSLGIRRCGYKTPIPSGTRRLMIPPERRKAAETMTQPYSFLWSEFRGLLRQGPQLINRLVVIGYGMRDEHVNAIIENGLARSNLTLLIFSRNLAPEVIDRWSPKRNVIIVTNDCCSLYGEKASGHSELWSFKQLSQEV